MGVTAPRWLTHDEGLAWVPIIRGCGYLTDELHRRLRAGFGLTLAEFELLTVLSHAPDRRLRMSQVADNLFHSRSRVTHTTHRLEARGLIRREVFSDSRGRAVVAILTDDGFDLLDRAARAHVEHVRELLFDTADPADIRGAGRAFRAMLVAGGAPVPDAW